jgi:hypothetical protein
MLTFPVTVDVNRLGAERTTRQSHSLAATTIRLCSANVLDFYGSACVVARLLKDYTLYPACVHVYCNLYSIVSNLSGVCSTLAVTWRGV